MSVARPLRSRLAVSFQSGSVLLMSFPELTGRRKAPRRFFLFRARCPGASPPSVECKLHRRWDFAGWDCDAHARIQVIIQLRPCQMCT